MDWIAILILATAVSLDSFFIGVTYGAAKIAVPTGARFLVSLISALFLLLAMTAGAWFSSWLPDDLLRWVGSSLLMGIGIYSILRGSAGSTCEDEELRFFGVIRQPLAADQDCSMHISLNEALVLGCALALDALAAGFGAALLNIPAVPAAIAVMAANYGFLRFGLVTGDSVHAQLPIASWLPGTLIIALGICRLFF